MEVKCLELRDRGTFVPVICIRPLPDNEGQRYLLRRDGYSCDPNDNIVIMINARCRGASYDPYGWARRHPHQAGGAPVHREELVDSEGRRCGRRPVHPGRDSGTETIRAREGTAVMAEGEYQTT